MIRLWVDDLRPMPKNFDKHARTAGEAIAELSTGHVTEISLDHDLGPEDAGTGYDVAAWIEREVALSEFVPPRWGVHSSNPVGFARIERALVSAWQIHIAREKECIE